MPGYTKANELPYSRISPGACARQKDAKATHSRCLSSSALGQGALQELREAEGVQDLPDSIPPFPLILLRCLELMPLLGYSNSKFIYFNSQNVNIIECVLEGRDNNII